MAFGTVKWFSPDIGFGFISQHNGVDILVTGQAVNDAGLSTLNEGQEISYEIAPSPSARQRVTDIRLMQVNA